MGRRRDSLIVHPHILEICAPSSKHRKPRRLSAGRLRGQCVRALSRRKAAHKGHRGTDARDTTAALCLEVFTYQKQEIRPHVSDCGENYDRRQNVPIFFFSWVIIIQAELINESMYSVLAELVRKIKTRIVGFLSAKLTTGYSGRREQSQCIHY